MTQQCTVKSVETTGNETTGNAGRPRQPTGKGPVESW